MKIQLVLFLALPLLASGAQNRAGAGASTSGTNPACARSAECPLALVTAATPTTLSASDLPFAIEEERVAHDLYAAAATRWNLPVLTNLAVRSVTYVPQVLAADDFSAFANSAPGGGGDNCANGGGGRG